MILSVKSCPYLVKSSARTEPTRIHASTMPVINRVTTAMIPNVENLRTKSQVSDAHSIV